MRERTGPTGAAALLLTALALPGTPPGAASRTPLTFATPPAVGDAVAGQPYLVLCDSRAAARTSARTGFLAFGCRGFGPGADAGWRVVELTHERIEDGGLWLVRVARRPRDGAPTTGWIPLPWHDWA